MMKAGYNEHYRKVTLEQALSVFDKMKKKNRKQCSLATCGMFIAPIIIPSNPNSDLLKMMREVARTESEPGLRFKVVETGGTTIKREDQSYRPTGDCPACHGGRGQGGNCCRSNIQ